MRILNEEKCGGHGMGWSGLEMQGARDVKGTNERG